ncbi:MAG: SPASM domain-containing protein, partial [Halanaerobium sp.]
EYKLGNINQKNILAMMSSEEQQQFGKAKKEGLNQKCLECNYLFFCSGGCPKNRILDKGNDYRLNYLCDGYKLFFNYIDVFMDKLSRLVKAKKPPKLMRKEMQKIYQDKWNVGRNDPCPCGSGKKYKKCCL